MVNGGRGATNMEGLDYREGIAKGTAGNEAGPIRQ